MFMLQYHMTSRQVTGSKSWTDNTSVYNKLNLNHKPIFKRITFAWHEIKLRMFR